MTSKILIGPSSFAESDKKPLDRLLAAGFTVIDNRFKRKMTREELHTLLKEDVVGILAGLEPLDRDVLSQSHLKCISRVGAGMNNVDIEAAKELNIAVFNTPDGPTSAVAELTVGALVTLLRWLPQSHQALHDRKWVRKIGGQIEGKTIAIIGFGRIGRRVAELLAPFRAQLIAVDPFLVKSLTLPCPLLPMEEALSQADIITIHTSGDECLFDAAAFSLMKSGTLLLNAARGSIISEKALINALDKGIVAGAWLDTFEKEPYEGLLCSYENVVLTPHIGSYTAECRQNMENEAVSNLLKVLQK
ncbi:MAG: phosphoglycerate dehydrogenase [Pseudomonadota bacterium]